MVAHSSTRVEDNTPQSSSERIEREMRKNIAYFAQHPEEIDKRLAQLDGEWDIERALETMAAGVGAYSVLRALVGSRLWLLLSGAVTAFLLQHAIQGWCPPLPVLRALGFRTQREIDEERSALKALRGDFKDLGGEGQRDADKAIDAAKM